MHAKEYQLWVNVSSQEQIYRFLENFFEKQTNNMKNRNLFLKKLTFELCDSNRVRVK